MPPASAASLDGQVHGPGFAGNGWAASFESFSSSWSQWQHEDARETQRLDYTATKGAIVAFTKGLAQHLIDRGIRVNCVAPGPVWTPLVVASFHEEKNAQFGKGYPMERPAQPAELAPSYVFLASDESRYVVGEVLGVTGGKPLG